MGETGRSSPALASYWTALSDGRFESAVTFPVFYPDEFQAGFDQLGTDRH